MPGSAEQVDMSSAGLRSRLLPLQDSLRLVMQKGMNLFDDYYELAPHPSEVDPNFGVYSVASANRCLETGLPMIREFTVVVGSRKWVRVFKNTDSSPDSFPRQRVWLWQPNEDYMRKTDIFYTHNPRREDYPYDIETADYKENGTIHGFIGLGYVDQEPFIEEVSRELDEAYKVASITLN